MEMLKMGGMGFCGSDLQCCRVGRVGNAVVREPMALGHEIICVIDKAGACREFPLAARLADTGRPDISPLVTACHPLARAADAILAASGKTRSMKVVLLGG